MSSFAKMGPFNPGHLFGQVCQRSPQFRGFQQQDAHELLRHLMESLRNEEVKRQKSAILKQFGLNEKTDPKTVDSKTKRKLQALGRHSNYTIIDKMFGGHLVSTIVCEQCHHSSQIYEPFLDLSLSLFEEKPQRPKKNKVNDEDGSEVSCFGNKKRNDDEGVKSKRQLRKEKERNRKEKRKNRRNKVSESKEDNEDEEKDNIIEQEVGEINGNKEEVDKEEIISKEESDGENKIKEELKESEKSDKEESELQETIKQESQETKEENDKGPSLTLNDVGEKSSVFEKKKSKNGKE